MLNQLPLELKLKILSHLNVHDLRNVQLVSRSWRSIFVTNEPSIYRHAAYVHALTPDPDISLDEAKDISPPCSMHGVNSWKSLTQRRFENEYRWQGHWNPGIKELYSAGSTVHRIKVDQEAGYIITTSSQGGLIVTDLVSNEVLWSLSQNYVTKYAHCEYDCGFIVFNNEGSNKEVWRRSCDCTGTWRPAESLPRANQLRASEEAAQRHNSTTRRGHFEPWAFLEMPEEGRAFRMVYPTLLVSGWNRAFLWDVPTARLRATIHDIQMPVGNGPNDALGQITYVELSDRFVIICGHFQLRIFSNSSQGTFLFHLAGWRKPHARWTLSLLKKSEDDHTRPAPRYTPRLFSLKDNSSYVLRSTPLFSAHDYFIAAHVTPCGTILVALLASGTVIIIRNLDGVVKGEIALVDASVEIDLRHETENPWWLMTDSYSFPYSLYLAVGDGRIGVATKGGIYVITLDKFKHGIVVREDESDPALLKTQFPNISICQEARFGDILSLASLSCLQMTAVGLYFNLRLSGKYPCIDDAMQSEPPMSEAATMEDLVGPNNLKDDSDHEAEGDDTGYTTALEDLPTQENLIKNSTSAPTLIQVEDTPEDGDYDLDDVMSELMSVSESSHSDSDVDFYPRRPLICMSFAPIYDYNA